MKFDMSEYWRLALGPISQDDSFIQQDVESRNYRTQRHVADNPELYPMDCKAGADPLGALEFVKIARRVS